MRSGILETMPNCGLPNADRSQSHRAFGGHNCLTLGKRYDIVDRGGGNVVVLDDDGRRASFAASRLVNQD
jgi:hypothetical protein